MRYRSFYRGRHYKWRRRKRGPGVLRRWFAGRRRRVRRYTRRRRRGYRKRQYITPVMQWMPKSRQKCTITGWTYAITCSTDQVAGRAGETTTKPLFEYKPTLGCCNIITLSLKWFYWEWKHFRNTWSTSNEGYDLARYFGTTFYLWPHPTVDYGVWWDTEYGGYTIDDLRHLAPQILILEKNHIVVLSERHGNKKPTKLRLRPPSIQDTNWYMQNRWCDVGLARVGFTLLNFQKPLMHTQRRQLYFYIGVTGVESKISGFTNPTAPPDYDTKITSLTGNNITGGKAKKVYYRPDMDTGEDNMVKVYIKTTEGQYNSYIVTANVPYFVWFYGWRYGDIATLGLPPNKFPQTTATTMVFWWYDYDGTETYNFKSNTKQWVVLSTTENPTYPQSIVQGGISTMMFLTTMGPLATTDKDIQYLDRDTDIMNTNISIITKYKSYWQWGGQTMHSGKDVKNPYPSNVIRGVQAADPSTTYETALHPWDMDNTGLITKEKLQQLIAPSRQEDQLDTNTPPQEDQEEDPFTDTDTESSDWPSSAEEELSIDNGISQARQKAEIADRRARHERQRRKQYQRRLRAWLAKL
nr:ORF1 [Red fox Torque teno virus 1]